MTTETILLCKEVYEALEENCAFHELYRVIDILGETETRNLLKQTLDIQISGGMRIDSEGRDRTAGGVFFYLAKQTIPRSVFYPRTRKKKARPDWDRRLTHYGKRTHGRINSMELKVVGRPKQSFNRGEYYEVPLDQKAAAELGVPKGLPIPPAENVKCVLYVAAKRWRAIAAEIYEDDTALVVAKGLFHPDYEQGRIIIFCKDVITAHKKNGVDGAQA